MLVCLRQHELDIFIPPSGAECGETFRQWIKFSDEEITSLSFRAPPALMIAMSIFWTIFGFIFSIFHVAIRGSIYIDATASYHQLNYVRSLFAFVLFSRYCFITFRWKWQQQRRTLTNNCSTSTDTIKRENFPRNFSVDSIEIPLPPTSLFKVQISSSFDFCYSSCGGWMKSHSSIHVKCFSQSNARDFQEPHKQFPFSTPWTIDPIKWNTWKRLKLKLESERNENRKR